MPAGERRRQLHAWLSPEAIAAWRQFARSHHTNVTALLEALGRHLEKLDTEPSGRLPALMRDAVKDAQEIAGSRLNRHDGAT